MKLIASGVTFSAAIVRSPFVLAILIVDDDDHACPARKASTASSMRANGLAGFRAPLAIFMSALSCFARLV